MLCEVFEADFLLWAASASSVQCFHDYVEVRP